MVLPVMVAAGMAVPFWSAGGMEGSAATSCAAGRFQAETNQV
jgi:hypothetical protein